jgi:hypothetical protein
MPGFKFIENVFYFSGLAKIADVLRQTFAGWLTEVLAI